MRPLFAWLPFAVALLLAFVAGVVFARLNESWVSSTSAQARGGISRLHRADIVLTTTLIGLLVAVLLVWLVAVVSLVHRG